MKYHSQKCNICKPPRLNEQDFKRLNHIPDPTPGIYDQNCTQFNEVSDNKTTEDAMQALKTQQIMETKSHLTLLSNMWVLHI